MRAAGHRHIGDERGAALLIVLLMIVVLGLTIGIAGSTWKSVTQRARESELFWRGDQYRKAIKSYYEVKHGATGLYPQKLESLLKDPRFLGAIRHIRQLYSDPISGEDWVLIKDKSGRITGVHSSSNLEPFKKDGFAQEYESFKDSGSYSSWGFVYEPKTKKTAAASKKPVEENP